MTDASRLLLPFLLACSVAVTADPEPTYAEPVFVLLRHAEKEAGVSDPGLTPAGRARARFIAERWGDAERGIEAVWSSDYHRTRDTAQPLADRLGLEIRLYDPGRLDELAARLKQQAVNAVVIGHSNTTPQLAALLCQCEVPAMPDTDYERAYHLFPNGDEYALQAIDFLRIWSDRPAPAD